jgi:hypothetical protein
MENTNITESVKSFVAKNQEAFDTYAQANLPRLWEDGNTTKLEFVLAKKYFKVWACRYGRRESIHAFIDATTGDIYMPAGLNKPAKHARGNVFSERNGAEAFGQGGYINYMR